MLLLLGLAAYALGRGTTDGSAAYSGTTAEVVGATFAASATVVGCFLVVDLLPGPGARRVLQPLLATGRLALTAYTVQILWLALLAALRDDAPQDNAWWVLGSTPRGGHRAVLGARPALGHRPARVGAAPAAPAATTGRAAPEHHGGSK